MKIEEIALKLACWDKSIRVQKKKAYERSRGDSFEATAQSAFKKEQRSTGSLQKPERANDWVLESRA